MPICSSCGSYFTRADLGCPNCRDSSTILKSSTKTSKSKEFSTSHGPEQEKFFLIKVGIISFIIELEDSIIKWFPDSFEDSYLLVTGLHSGSSSFELKLSSGQSRDVKTSLNLMTRRRKFRKKHLLETYFKGIKFLLIFVGNEITERDLKEILEIGQTVVKVGHGSRQQPFQVILVTWDEPRFKNGDDENQSSEPLPPDKLANAFTRLMDTLHELRPEMSVLVVQKHLPILNEGTFNELVQEITSQWLLSSLEQPERA